MTRTACTGWVVAAVLAACGTPEELPSPATGIQLLHQVPAVMTPGQRVPDLVAVRVVDEAGNGRPGVPLTWGVEDGGGHISETMAVTGLDGFASTRWILGPFPGRQSLAISVPGEGATRVITDARAFTAPRIDAGINYVCGIVEAALWCSGTEWAAGSEVGTYAPLRLLPGIAVTAVAAGDGNLCALEVSGQPVCLALNGGSLGQPPTGRPAVPPLRHVTSGDQYFCGTARADGTPWCWTMRYASGDATSIQQVSTSLRLEAISAGNGYGCGLDGGGTAWCWRSLPLDSAAPPRQVVGVAFRNIAASGDTPCGATIARDVVCMSVDSLVPWQVHGLKADWVRCGYRTCVVPERTGISRFSRWLPAHWYTEVGFVVANASADDDICVQGAAAEVYCGSHIAGSAAAPFEGQEFFAIPAIEGPR